jgi:hypothetical protein
MYYPCKSAQIRLIRVPFTFLKSLFHFSCIKINYHENYKYDYREKSHYHYT